MTTTTTRGRPRAAGLRRHEFSTTLRAWMARHGYTIAQAATALGRSPRTVDNWSQGRRAPSSRGSAPTQLEVLLKQLEV